MNTRIYNLKEAILGARPMWSLERARLVTAAYQEHEADTYMAKKAFALAKVLEEKRIFISPGELIVGNYSVRPGAYELYPEYSLQDQVHRYTHFSFEKMIDESYFETEEEKAEFRGIRDFWKGKCMRDIAEQVMPDICKKTRSLEIVGNAYGRDEGQGHITVEYDRVIREGFRAIIDQAKKNLDEKGLQDPKAYDFLRAVIITSEAIISFAHRFAELATALAADESDPTRREELRRIARTCRRVPELPAESFYEACQAFWFVHVVMHQEQNGFSISPGRFDQYMYPLYRRDIDAGAITDEQVLELIENLWVNCMSITIGGIMISMTQTVMLGGKDLDDRDMTNELSFLCIKADRATRMVQPSLMVRWHKNIDRRIMEEVMEATYTGEASIAMISDEAIIPSLMKVGVKREDAYDYVQVGCNETELPGKMMGGGLPRPVFMLRLIDIALCGGKWRPTGEQIGPKTKALGEYTCFEDFVEAYRTQINHFVRYTSLAVNLMDYLHSIYRPLPFASSLMTNAIERGRDIHSQLEYFFYAAGGNDFIPAVNSFAAIKKAVFEDKSVTQEELNAAITANYEGHEPTRKKLWSAPKFGNDDEFVDSLMGLVSGLGKEAFAPYRSYRNNSPWIWECIPRISHVYEGLRMWATPDGRKQGTSLAAGISGQSGTELNGPTAFLNSVAKLDADQFVGGVITNLRLHPNLLKDAESRGKTIDLLNAYFKKGGQHVQLNCVTKETLLDAQQHPEKHRDLMVRVSGYVDYFLNLDEASRADIIRRTIHEAK